MEYTKTPLQILLTPEFRFELSYLYKNRYQEKYPSFSVFIEALLRKSLEGL